MCKKNSALLLLFFCFLFSGFSTIAQHKNLLKTIIVDAGHGGHDGGAAGRYSAEKEISLALALKLQDAIYKHLPDIKVVMTRTNDVYQHPVVKANIANQNKGDLFISIHCNSAPPAVIKELKGYKMETYYEKKKNGKKKRRTREVPVYTYKTIPNPAKGTETYIWGAHKNDMKEKAMQENEALYLDPKLAEQVKDFNPDSPEKMILYSLKTKQYFTRSATLAMTVEEEFRKVGRISREVKQRQVGIWVLQATAMPSILIEAGYISNPEEEDYMNSEKGQDEIVSAIIKALIRYQKALQGK